MGGWAGISAGVHRVEREERVWGWVCQATRIAGRVCRCRKKRGCSGAGGCRWMQAGGCVHVYYDRGPSKAIPQGKAQPGHWRRAEVHAGCALRAAPAGVRPSKARSCAGAPARACEPAKSREYGRRSLSSARAAVK